MEKFYWQLEEIIEKSLGALFPQRQIPFFLEIPRNKKFGDLSLSVCLKLSSLTKQSPLSLAEQLKQKIEASLTRHNPGIRKVDIVAPGFVNFFLKNETVKLLLMDLLKKDSKFFKRTLGVKQKVLLEFVSANPTGPLSIAHGRQAVVGDVLANLLSFSGFKVVKEYYINDEGTQIDLFVESVIERMKEAKNEPFQIPKQGYQGEYVKDIAEKIISFHKELNLQGVRSASLKLVLKEIKEDLQSLGVCFMSWVSQSALQKKGKINKVIKKLKDMGLTYAKDDAFWFKSTNFGDDKDRVLVRKDKTATYFAADIAYHREKLKRKFDVLLNLWGPDHHGYVKRLKSSLKALQIKEKLEFIFDVIIIQLVSVKNRKMSKRQGTILLLKDLVSQVGQDAARFYYLLRKNSSHLEFDVDLAQARSFDNPLYYIQYAHARICSIIGKHNYRLNLKNLDLLKENQEVSLIKEILHFRNILELAVQQREPYFIVDYLRNLAASFHKYYETHRVLIYDDLNLTQARLALIKAVKIVLNLGLSLLKVEAPTRM